MKVLLISPLPGIDPACGDVIYTQMLLAHPPAGVQYETYADALKRGALVEHGRRDRFRNEPLLTAACRIINLLRSKRVLFWEPFRIFSVKPGEYDVVHLHVFSGGFRAIDCPLVISNAAPLRFLYTEARGWSHLRTRVVEKIEIAIAAALGVNHVSYRVPQAARLIAFTQFLKDWYVNQRIFPRGRIDVVPIYLPAPASVPAPRPDPNRVGFIAKDFDAKGGPALLKAWDIVRAARPDAMLTIVGCPPRIGAEAAAARGIQWLPYVERSKLLGEIMPGWDVFAYPTEFDGLPLVVLEAMSVGIPVAISDYQAMPEIIGSGGLVSCGRDEKALASNLVRLLEPKVNKRYREAAADRFRSTFSEAAVRPSLAACYTASLARH